MPAPWRLAWLCAIVVRRCTPCTVVCYVPLCSVVYHCVLVVHHRMPVCAVVCGRFHLISIDKAVAKKQQGKQEGDRARQT